MSPHKRLGGVSGGGAVRRMTDWEAGLWWQLQFSSITSTSVTGGGVRK